MVDLSIQALRAEAVATGKVTYEQAQKLGKEELSLLLAGNGEYTFGSEGLIRDVDIPKGQTLLENLRLWGNAFLEIFPHTQAGESLKAGATTLAMVLPVSCTSDSFVKQGDYIQIDSDVNFTIKSNENYKALETLVKELITLIKKGNEIDKQQLAELGRLIELLEKADFKLSEIIEELTKQGLDLKDIIALLQKQGKTLTDIADTLVEMGKDAKTIIDLLKQNGATLTEILLATKDNGDILKVLAGNNQDILAALKTVINNQEAHSKEFNKHNELLNAILAKIQELDLNDKDNAEIKTLLVNMLNRFNEFMTNEEENDKEQSDLLKVLIEEVRFGRTEFNAFAAAIQGNITNFEKNVIQAIKDLVPHMDKLSGDVIKTIKGLVLPESGVTVDLTKIEKLLEELLKEQIDTNGRLAAMELALGGMQKTLEGIKDNTDDLKKGQDVIIDLLNNLVGMAGITQDKLNTIIAKIPAKCDCKTNIEVIIGKLDEIIKNLKTDGNHEGILDDLDDYLG